MAGFLATLGMGAETTYGTPAVPDHFVEMVSEGLKGKYVRIDSKGLGRGSVVRSDRFVVVPGGAAGAIAVEVKTGGLQFLLPYMLGGTPVVTAADSNGLTTYTATPGSLYGKSFTTQVGRPDLLGNIHPFTYTGCKVNDWEVTAGKGQLVDLKLTVDGRQELLSTPYTTPVWSTTPRENMSFVGGSVTVGGASVDVIKCSIKGANGLLSGRQYISADGLPREQVENAMRSFSFSLDLDFTDTTLLALVTAATAAGTLASVNLHFQGASTVGTSGHPGLTISMPASRFDTDVPVVAGPGELTYTAAGQALLDPTSGYAIQMSYSTPEATV